MAAVKLERLVLGHFVRCEQAQFYTPYTCLQQVVILNYAFIVKFPLVVVVVYVATSLLNRDEYIKPLYGLALYITVHLG